MTKAPVTKELNVILNFVLDFLTQCYFVSFQFNNTAGFKLATSPYHDRNGGNSRGSNPGVFSILSGIFAERPLTIKRYLGCKESNGPCQTPIMESFC